MKKLLFIFSFIFIFLIIPFIFKVYAARLTPIQDIMSNNTVSAVSNNNLIFTANGGLPSDASVTIIFPSGFSNINVSTATSNLTGSTFSLSGNTVTLSTTNVSESPGYQVNINNIYATNPSSISSSTVQYIINVSDSAGDSAGIGVVITSYSSYGSGPSGDQYQQTITINNTNTVALTNYQIELTLNTASLISAGQMQSDCADIRFTDSSGIILPYWIESGCNTTTTQIWVNVNNIAASSNTLIYLYYGSPSANIGENPYNTFNYFDPGNLLSSWTTVGSAGQNTNIGDPAPSYYANSSNGDYMYKNIQLLPGEEITFNGETTASGDFFFMTNSSGLGQMYSFGTNSGEFGFATTNSWTSWNGPSGTSPIVANTWYKFQVIVNSAGTQASLYYKATTGDSPTINGTLVGTYNITNNGGYIGLVGAGAGGSNITYWNNIIVNQYNSINPTVTIGTTVTELQNNQVELSLNVSPYIIFGVSSNTVNLGLLSFSYITSQSNYLSLSTNAEDGANISVEDEYSGLYSSLDSYTIPSSTQTLSVGSQGYGINASSSAINIQYPYNSSGDSVGGLTSSQNVELASSNNIVQNANINLNYLSSVSVSTPAEVYIDNITYIASGNF